MPMLLATGCQYASIVGDRHDFTDIIARLQNHGSLKYGITHEKVHEGSCNVPVPFFATVSMEWQGRLSAVVQAAFHLWGHDLSSMFDKSIKRLISLEAHATRGGLGYRKMTGIAGVGFRPSRHE